MNYFRPIPPVYPGYPKPKPKGYGYPNINPLKPYFNQWVKIQFSNGRVIFGQPVRENAQDPNSVVDMLLYPQNAIVPMDVTEILFVEPIYMHPSQYLQLQQIGGGIPSSPNPYGMSYNPYGTTTARPLYEPYW